MATDRRPVCSPRQGPCWRAGQGRARNAAVFISQGDPNKGPRTRALETADVYGLLVLEAGDPRSRCLRPSSLRGSKRGSFFASPGSDGCWQSLAYTCIPTVSACRHRACSPPVSLSTFPSTNTGILDEGPTRNQHDLLLTHTLITSAVTLFPNKVTCTGPGVRAPTYLLGTHFNP